MENMEGRQLAVLPYCPYLITLRLVFLPYFHIIPEFNLHFFCTFLIFSLFKLPFLHMFPKEKEFE
jgi:hypothetical protein